MLENNLLGGFTAKMKKHKLYNLENGPLEMIAVCVPALEPENTVWLEEV